jgi:hypothetical protein
VYASWTLPFEQLIGQVGKVPTNNKVPENTFAKRFVLRQATSAVDQLKTADENKLVMDSLRFVSISVLVCLGFAISIR